MQTTRRITFEVSEEQYQKLKDHLEYGLMKKLFGALVEDVVVMLEDYGKLFVVAVLTKRVSYSGLMKEQNSAEVKI